jgi:MOSC domain-containing protein YiiM
MDADREQSELGALIRSVPQTGRVEWIGRAAARRGPIEVLDAVGLEVGTGLEGEHHARSARGPAPPKRQVTLIQHEHLAAIAALLGRDELDPALLRRNLVVARIPLLALKDRRFRIGEALLEGSGPCPPCSRMEEALGPGGYQAMRGHGGITAVVLEPGTVHVGDAVTVEPG